jgi:hypothetical protein
VDRSAHGASGSLRRGSGARKDREPGARTVIRRISARLRRWFLGERLYRLGREGDPDLRILALNVKNFGYLLARQLQPALRAVSVEGEPRVRDLGWRASTQADVESPWFAYWCSQLRTAPFYHRKLWEYAYVLQALHDAGVMRDGARGLGFGCGEEPIASYLASRAVEVTVTDLDPARARGLGWMETGQHTSAIEQAFRADLVSRDVFDRHVRLEYVDMNDIPADLDGRHDFCWSICALEHLGSIDHGLKFVERSMDTLRPGGVAVHTSEFSYFEGDALVDRGPTVLFRRSHYEGLAERLRRRGFEVGGVSFDTGTDPLDRFIDVPPYSWDAEVAHRWGQLGVDVGHLKLSVDGVASTCFGLVVRKPVGGAR